MAAASPPHVPQGEPPAHRERRRRAPPLRDSEASLMVGLVKAVAWPAAAVLVAAAALQALPRPLPVGTLSVRPEVVTGLAWPLVALVFLLLLRKPLSTFLSGIGQRVSKLSVGVVALELSQVAELRPWSGPSLEDIRRPEPARSPVGSMPGSMLSSISVQVDWGEPADYTIINLGLGKSWLTSRLFILAVLIERMRGVRCLVFLAEEAGRERFVGTALPREVRWAFAKECPWLEAAYVRAYHKAVGGNDPKYMTHGSTFITTAQGGLTVPVAQQLLTSFLDEVQAKGSPAPYAMMMSSPPGPAPAHGEDWQELRQGALRERAAWLDEGRLRRIMGDHFYDSWCPEEIDAPAEERVRRVLRRAAPFVAVLGEGHRFKSLVDRQALLEALAVKVRSEGAGK